MHIEKVVGFIEEYKHKTGDELKILADIFSDDPFASEEDKKFYNYLGKFLPRFFAFKVNEGVTDKSLLEQMALFYESDEIKKPVDAAVCWTLFFKKHLDKHSNPLGYIGFSESFFYEPNRFFGFLCYLLGQDISPQAILKTHIIHRFFQYNCDFTNSEDGIIRQFLHLFDRITDSRVKLLLVEISKTEIMFRKKFAIGFSRDAENNWLFKMVPSTTERFGYDLPVFVNDVDVDQAIGLYSCFQMDFVRKLNFSKEKVIDFFGDFFAELLRLNMHFDLNELFSFVLTEIKYDQTRLILLKLFDAHRPLLGEESAFTALVERHPNFIFAMLTGFSEYRDSITELQIILTAPDFRSFVLENNIVLKASHFQILLKYLSASTNVNADIFFALFDILKKIILENKAEPETDRAIYGVPNHVLRGIAKLRGVYEAVSQYVEEINAPVFQKINEGADFASICAQWQLAVLNVFKRICPALFSDAGFLGSINDLKVVVLQNSWTTAVKLSDDFSMEVEELFSFSRVFASFSRDKEGVLIPIDKDEECRILLDMLIATNDNKLMRACINYLKYCLHVTDWVQKIVSDSFSLERLIINNNKALLKQMKLNSNGFFKVFLQAFAIPTNVLKIESYCFNHIDFSQFKTVELVKLLSLILPRRNPIYEEKIFNLLGVSPSFALMLIGGCSKNVIESSVERITDRAAAVLLGVSMIQPTPPVNDQEDSICYLSGIVSNYDDFAFAFNHADKNTYNKKVLVAAIVDRKLKSNSDFFAAEASLSWWNGKQCDSFYVACAFEIINKKYMGSRKEKLKALSPYNNNWLQATKSFLETSRTTQKSSKLNQALTELVAQAEGIKTVSMEGICNQLNPKPGPDDVRVFSPCSPR